MAADRQGRARVLLVVLFVASSLLSASPAVAGNAPTATGGLAPSLDFNGDNYADLAVGVPYDDGDGAVNVIYGSRTGLTALGNERWAQDSAGVKGLGEHEDHFGDVVAGGDFNGDGRDDLVVGVPWDKVGTRREAGAVQVLYGAAGGLTAYGDQLWSQNSRGVPGTAERSDFFGTSLAPGNFDGDRYDDLAIGSPREGVGTKKYAGLVTILYGSSSGLRSRESRALTQASAGLSRVDAFGQFGAAMAVGDANRDGYGDLAVGAPGSGDVGEVQIFLGSRTGVTTRRATRWTQNSSGVAGKAEVSDSFGAGLAFGDFDGNGHADLAIGVPNEGVTACAQCDAQGAVNVLYGRSGGLRAGNGQSLHAYGGGLPGPGSTRLGTTLVAGDFNGDRRWELVIDGAGVFVVPGSPTGLKPDAASSWVHDGGAARSFAVGNYAGGARHGLALGIPNTSVPEPGPDPDSEFATEGVGEVAVLYGSSTGLTSAGKQTWSQDSPGIRGTAEVEEYFGHIGRYGDPT